MTGEFSQADEAAMEQRLRRFCKIYYAELRQRMAEYPAASEIFPYYLTGYRRIIATLTKDGIVMVHWFAEKDTFEFRSSPDKRVTDLTEELAIVYPNGMKAV